MDPDRKKLEQKLQDIAEGRLDSLQLYGDRLTGTDVERIAQLIRHAPHLRYIGVNTGLNEAALSLIADAVSHRSDIEDFSLTNMNISPANAKELASGLSPNRRLQSLKLSWSVSQADVLDPFIDLIADTPRLQKLFLTGGVWDQPRHQRLAEALRDKKDLVTLEFSPSQQEEEPALSYSCFEEALLESPHPNLLFFNVNPLATLNTLLTNNIAHASKVTEELRPLLYGMQEDYASLAKHTTPQLVAAAAALTPALITKNAFSSDKGTRYRTFLDGLPTLSRLPESGIDDALFAKDEQNFAPIDNPHTWANHPQLLKRLTEEAPLTRERLDRRNENGLSLLEAAFAYLPAKTVLASLNAAGIRINQNDLFDTKGKPTPLLDILEKKQEVGALLTRGNWQHATQHELNAFLRKFSPETRATFSGMENVLRYTSRPLQSERGRGR